MDNFKNLRNKIIFSKYKIHSLVGIGVFSQVFSVENIKNGKLYAAKIESKKTTRSKLLKAEAYHLYELKGFGIPEIISYGHSGEYDILIQQLLGKTLKELFKKSKNKIKDVCMAGIQLLDRIEFVHSKYIVHRDIKPENFLVGKPDLSIIYLIDFGFSKKYRSSRTKKHITFKRNKCYPGTVGFISLNGSSGIEQTRRDDLESLAYSLIYLSNGTLPWYNVKSKTFEEHQKKIYDIKKNISIEDLCKGLPKEFVIYIDYVKKLEFEEQPNYNYFLGLMKKIEVNIRKFRRNE